MKEEAEEKLNKYFKKNFSDLTGYYKVIVQPINNIDLNNNDNIKNLVNSIYMTFLSKDPDSATRLYILVRQFAKSLNDFEEVIKLESIYQAREVKLPVPIIEMTIAKYITSKTYKLRKPVRCGKKLYTLGELNRYLQEKKRMIVDIFFELYNDNNINVPFQLPNFNNMAGGLSYE